MQTRPRGVCTRARFVTLVAPLIASALAAQTPFADLAKAHLPRDGARNFRIALGDVDGDGALDVIASIATVPGSIRVYIQSASTVFAEARVYPGFLNPQPVLADFDGDRDRDVFVAGYSSSSAGLLLNDGRGNFTRGGQMPASSNVAYIAAAGDVDRDGDIDLVVGGGTQLPTRLWLNDGRGAFTEAPATQMPAIVANNTALLLSDIDADGDLDLVVGNSGYVYSHSYIPVPNRLYRNDGRGFFVDASAQLPPPVQSNTTSAVAAADVDGDGDLDLAIADQPATRLWLNDGTGSFTEVAGRIPAGSGAATGLAWLDLEGDGDRDLLLSGASIRVYVNDGLGRFAEQTLARVPDPSGQTFGIAAGDIDRDGDQDVVFAVEGQNRLLLNDGVGVFSEGTAARWPWLEARTSAIGDVDGDGDLDVVLGSKTWINDGAGGVLRRNDGHGRFATVAGAMPPEVEEIHSPMVLVDVDGDGDRDLLFRAWISSPYSHHPRLYVNDGRGNFSDATPGRIPPTEAQAFVAGDIDGDGDVDVITCGYQGQEKVLVNDGRGVFTEMAGRLPAPGSTFIHDLKLGDVDRDGDLDVVAIRVDYGSSVRQIRLLLNDGTGTFTDATAARVPALRGYFQVVALGDVDGDRDLDVVIGCWGSPSYPGERHVLLLNTGAGAFVEGTAGRLPSTLAGTYDAALVDVDADGDLDLLIGVESASIDVLWRNDGRGTFTDAGAIARGYLLTAAGGYSVADLDGDGDLDLVRYDTTGGGSRTHLLVNLHGHVHAPWLARTRARYRVEFFSQPGYGAAAVAVPFFATATARIVLPPFGTFGLDPAVTIPLPHVSIAQPSGRGQLEWTMPDDAALNGLAIFVQAAIVPSANLNDTRFTNVEPDRVRRL